MTSPHFDVTRKFVRIKGRMPNGFIEFEYAVGEPGMFAELVMAPADFDIFCRDNQVEMLGAQTPAAPDSPAADFQWSLHQATHQRFR